MATDSVQLFNKTLADQLLVKRQGISSAFGDKEMHLDYWGCYAKVFRGHPEGSISSLNYLPDEEEETFLLLSPNHLDQMITSLDEHIDDLSIMKKEDIQQLQTWRDYCLNNPSYMVAYLFDF